jgi:hypothetical protein
MNSIFSSPPFYTKYVCLPTAEDPVPTKIRNDSKFWPYFKDAVGALDGSHIHCSPPGRERGSYRNRKGFLSQNCLFGCSFDLQFVFTYTGWEGSATDAKVYENALVDGLDIPEGKYYLADAGFPSCDQLLIPYRAVRYHLAEWGRANTRYVSQFIINTTVYIVYRPKTKEELFNLRHSSARNVIERIFGVLKRRFRILLLAPEYSLQIQARIPAALCAIHNFIRIHDPAEDAIFTADDDDDNHGNPPLDQDLDHDHIANAAAAAEIDTPSLKRDQIAQAMWDDYLAITGQGNEDSDPGEEVDE